jgi:hypothetical protein
MNGVPAFEILQLVLGGGALALLSGIFTRLGRALAQLEHHSDRLDRLDKRVNDVEAGRTAVLAKLLEDRP